MSVPRLIVKRLLDGSHARVLLGFRPSERIPPAAYGHLELQGERVWLAVWTNDAYRHMGYGNIMLGALCAIADEDKLKVSLTSKPHLVRWYESAGFVTMNAPCGVTMAEGQTYMERIPNG